MRRLLRGPLRDPRCHARREHLARRWRRPASAGDRSLRDRRRLADGRAWHHPRYRPRDRAHLLDPGRAAAARRPGLLPQCVRRRDDHRGRRLLPGHQKAATMTDADARSGSLLRLEGVTKKYGRLTALRDVSLEIRPSEILALLGDNGAGKSTLIKIMSGVVQPDDGAMYWNGKQVELQSRGDSVRLGIETIYQDAALVDSMSIARNIFVGRELTGPGGFL